MLHQLTALGVLGILGLGAWVFQHLWHKREVADLSRRDSISMDDVYARYYATSGLSEVSVIEVWQEVAKTLDLPPGKLRPGDRFGHDVGTYLLTSDELDTLSELGAERARRLGIEVDLQKIYTVDEYARALARPSVAR